MQTEDGLGEREIAVLESLPADLREFLAEEARENPEFLDFLIPALRSGDAHGIILETIAREYTAYAMGAIDDSTECYAWETGMGKKKSWFKKVIKKIASIPKTIQKAIVKVLPKGLKKIIKKVGPWVSIGMPAKTFRKYSSIIIGLAGAVLAPFTGGASLVAAALIIKAREMYLAKNAATAAKKAAKADAAQQEQAAAAAEAEVMAQCDKFFADNIAYFAQYNITPEAWATLTLDGKIDLINAGAKGIAPVGLGPVVSPPAGASTDPSMQQVDDFYNKNQNLFIPYGVTPVMWSTLTLEQKLDIIRTGVEIPEGTVPPATGTAPTPPPVTTMPVQPVVRPVQTSTPAPYTSSQLPYVPPDSGPPPSTYYPPEVSQPTPPEPPSPVVKEAVDSITAKGTFDVYVEGVKVGTYDSLDLASKNVLMLAKSGDRFEVVANGVSTGLRVRTSSGSIDVPADIEAQVRAMDRSKMADFVSQAEKETGAGGGVPWYLILGGGAAAAAALALR